MKTNSCDKVWGAIKEVTRKLKYDNNESEESCKLANTLEDAFADFECGWVEHCHEYHPIE